MPPCQPVFRPRLQPGGVEAPFQPIRRPPLLLNPRGKPALLKLGPDTPNAPPLCPPPLAKAGGVSVSPKPTTTAIATLAQVFIALTS